MSQDRTIDQLTAIIRADVATGDKIPLWDASAGSTKAATVDELLGPEAVIAPTLLNGWGNFGSDYANAGYYKDRAGRVHLRGMISGGTATSGTVLFALPSGYRPANHQTFATVSNDALGGVLVLNTGDVQIRAGSATWLSLSGISFRAA